MNTTELKELAEKATPGPWSHEEIDPTDPEWGACEVFTEGRDTFVATHVCRVNDAAYIAAANPAEILELIAQLEDAQGEIRALRATEAGLRDRLAALEKAIMDAEPVAEIRMSDGGLSGVNRVTTKGVQVSVHRADGDWTPLYTLNGIKK